MAGSVVLVDCAAGFNSKPEGDHVVTFLSCDWNATTTLYEWVAHGTCSDAYVFSGRPALLAAVNAWVGSVTRVVGSLDVSQVHTLPPHLKTYGHISTWDTSKVTDMHKLFQSEYCMNQPIVDLTKISAYNRACFNDDISAWDTSKVTNMNRMFDANKHFNQDISGWKTSKVKDMGYMFHQAIAFNQPIGKWDTSQVVQIHMVSSGTSGMFSQAAAFDQNLRNWKTAICLFHAPQMFHEANRGMQSDAGYYKAWNNGCQCNANRHHTKTNRCTCNIHPISPCSWRP